MRIIPNQRHKSQSKSKQRSRRQRKKGALFQNNLPPTFFFFLQNNAHSIQLFHSSFMAVLFNSISSVEKEKKEKKKQNLLRGAQVIEKTLSLNTIKQ